MVVVVEGAQGSVRISTRAVEECNRTSSYVYYFVLSFGYFHVCFIM